MRPLAEALYERVGRLIDQAAKRHRAEQIVVWLDGPLRCLPLGLMHDGKQYLAARYRWVVAGGLAAPLPKALPARERPLQIAAFGVTQSLQGLPALPAVADELCDIVDGPVLGLEDGGLSRCALTARGRGPLRGQGRLNALFTEAALTQAGAGAGPGDLLHIGTHFVLRPGNVAKSWLLLGDGSRLPLERMRRMNMGVPRPWRVDDRATARFMQRFYAAYARQPGQASAALQQAQRQALADGAPERDWAAFVLMAQTAQVDRAGTP